MGSGFSQCACHFHLLQKSRLPKKSSIITISQKTISLVPDFNGDDVTNLLGEAEHELNSSEYNKSINLLLRATQLGSVHAAAKLGYIYLNGFADYNSSAVAYFIALKFTLLIPHASWDLDLILETVSSLSKLYSNQLGNPNNLDILNHGVKLMSEVDKNLQDPYFIRTRSYKQNQKRKASRVHINYCIAITAESKGDLLEALKGFEECELIGQCGIESADKLIKKIFFCMQKLDSTRPKVSPNCIQCNYEVRDLIDIRKLLSCTKCNNYVACCGRECLNKHIMTTHLERS